MGDTGRDAVRHHSLEGTVRLVRPAFARVGVNLVSAKEAVAPAMVHPNRTSGTIGSTNAHPDIRALLDRPLDKGWSVMAAARPPAAPFEPRTPRPTGRRGSSMPPSHEPCPRPADRLRSVRSPRQWVLSALHRCPLDRRTRTKAVIASAVASVAMTAAAGLPSTPVEQWRWMGALAAPERPYPSGNPVVVRLTDDDGDGAIGAGDRPAVVFMHFGGTEQSLTALDGETGDLRFTVSEPPLGLRWFRSAPMLAAGDLDGDGVVELVAANDDSVLVFRSDGRFDRAIDWPAPLLRYGQGLGVADIDADGVPEIYSHSQVVSAAGSLAWSAVTPRDGEAWASFAHAVDLLPDRRGLELLVGATLFDASGATVWSRTDIPAGATAVGDIDGDGQPEVALAGRFGTPDRGNAEPRRLHVLEVDGTDATAPVILGERGWPSQPLIADINGDGQVEIVVALHSALDAFRWSDGRLVLLWSVPMDDSSGVAGLSAFDFDGDCAMEIMHRDHSAWRIHEGRDGAVLHEEPFLSGTGVEFPFAADIDADGITEIVVTGVGLVDPRDPVDPTSVPSNAVVVYEVPNARSARGIRNQHDYHVTNVGDFGEVPRVEERPWEIGLGWGEQVGFGPDGPPPGVLATLRAVHEGQRIELHWPLARALQDGESFHLRKAVGPPWGAFTAVNLDAPDDRSYREIDTSSRLQFFDLRVERCGQLSRDEYPPSY